ncbi:hypothetical protein AAG570_006228 [Ranatra chinensis]|uniref:PID domain-containing protein n=1 Tax=Ranatra chinensis TaxID=642074 RepID=A0ABD0Z3Z6_9HEMI
MERLRRSFRDSFRRRKEQLPDSSKPHLWQADEAAVRAGTCTFHVKYLGCVEVFESRGMQVCEEALKVLRNSRRRPVKSVLFVSGDGLRVVEDETKGLIVDQTIEKVSFCAPDRSHDKGFSYICRDGTTRRWMCHGFLALKESGERLSHAVGCAFAACLERKQKRDKECGVTMNFDTTNSTFTRQGSFRQQTLTERLSNDNKNNSNATKVSNGNGKCTVQTGVPPLPAPPPPNPHAIARPHATVSMLVRQVSFRGFNHLNQSSPFKRQLSLRLADLPSNLERTRSMSLEGTNDSRVPPLIHLKTPVSPIPESSPLTEKTDPVSMMCQQLSHGLRLLSNSDDFQPSTQVNFPGISNNTFALNLTDSNNNVLNSPNSDFLARIESLKRTNDNHINNNNTNNNGGGVIPAVIPVGGETPLPNPDQWLGKVAAVASGGATGNRGRLPPTRALSVGSDPFDADWAAQTQSQNASTNPFLSGSTNTTPVKAFEVHM